MPAAEASNTHIAGLAVRISDRFRGT